MWLEKLFVAACSGLSLGMFVALPYALSISHKLYAFLK